MAPQQGVLETWLGWNLANCRTPWKGCSSDLHGEPLQKGALPLGNGDDEAEERPAKKKLKKNDSDVSLDSAGFPMMLKTPENEKKTAANPSRLLQKRVGQSVPQPEPTHENLKKAMGVGHLAKCLKKPAASGAFKKPAAAVKSTGAWHKIYKTTPKKKKEHTFVEPKPLEKSKSSLWKWLQQWASSICWS